ncbi:MAG: DUF2752 domain-containing protein [Alistipes sp.]|nr:DUF2752 domain-containing protein [Alistipes sp.]
MIVVAGIFLGFIYFFIDPSTSPFVPKCIFKVITGYDCPSCGVQRAVHAILHGEFVSALKLNPFIFVLSPYLLALLYTSLSKSALSQRLRFYTHHHVTIYIYLFLYIAWGVIRNTSFWLNLYK